MKLPVSHLYSAWLPRQMTGSRLLFQIRDSSRRGLAAFKNEDIIDVRVSITLSKMMQVVETRKCCEQHVVLAYNLKWSQNSQILAGANASKACCVASV